MKLFFLGQFLFFVGALLYWSASAFEIRMLLYPPYWCGLLRNVSLLVQLIGFAFILYSVIPTNSFTGALRF